MRSSFDSPTLFVLFPKTTYTLFAMHFPTSALILGAAIVAPSFAAPAGWSKRELAVDSSVAVDDSYVHYFFSLGPTIADMELIL